MVAFWGPTVASQVLSRVLRKLRGYVVCRAGRDEMVLQEERQPVPPSEVNRAAPSGQCGHSSEGLGGKCAAVVMWWPVWGTF